MRLLKRHDNAWNLLAYVLFVAALGVVTTLAVRVAYFYQSALDERYQVAEALAEWTSERVPKWLTPADTSRSRFREQLDALKGALGETAAPRSSVIAVSDLDRADRPAGTNGIALAQGSSWRVYPQVTVWSHPRNLAPPAEVLAVFRHFADYFASLKIDGATAKVPGTLPERLAQFLGIDSASYPHLSVPWAYVATPEGWQATFPGTNLVGNQPGARRDGGYDPGGRPWFQSVFSGALRLKSPVGGERPDEYLTVPYLDVQPQKPVQVRTYISVVNVGQRQYLLAIDLNRAENSEAEASRYLKSRTQMLQESIGTSLDFRVDRTLSVLLFAIVVSALEWNRRRTRQITKTLRFTLLQRVTAGTVVPVVTKTEITEQTRKGLVKVLGKIGGVLGLEASNERYWIETRRRELGTQEPLEAERGLDRWGVEECRDEGWRVLGLRFALSSARPHCEAVAKYGGRVAPELELDRTTGRPLPEGEELTKLERMVGRVAFLSDGSLEIPYDLSYEPPDRVPSLLTKYDEFAKHLEYRNQVAYRRFYFRKGLQLFAHIYANNAVRAVVQLRHLEHLLTVGADKFLGTGDSVERTVLVASEEDWTSFLRARPRSAKQLHGIYSTGGGRLFYVPVEGLGDEWRSFRERDFALIGATVPKSVAGVMTSKFVAELVVVSEEVVLERQLADSETRWHAENVRIRGYASWRPADIALFTRFLSALDEARTEVNLNDLDHAAVAASLPLTDSDANRSRV